MGAVLPFAAAGLSILGTIQGFMGQKAQAKAAANQAKYNSAVAENNALIAQRNASLAAQEGNAALETQLMENRAKIGAIKAAQAASGVNINTGSAVDVRSSAAETGQLSALNIRSNAIRKAYGYQQDAADYKTQAGLYDTQAHNEKVAGNINARTTLLGGLSDTAMNFSNYLDKRSTLGGDLA